MPEIKVYKMFGSVAASADAVASYDVQEDGEICSLYGWLHATGADALNDGGRFEVSFASVSGFTTNDTRASIFGLSALQSFLTTGGGGVFQNGFITFAPNGIPVAAGERMYLHSQVVGAPATLVGSIWVYHCLDRGGTPRARAVRRTS